MCVEVISKCAQVNVKDHWLSNRYKPGSARHQKWEIRFALQRLRRGRKFRCIRGPPAICLQRFAGEALFIGKLVDIGKAFDRKLGKLDRWGGAKAHSEPRIDDELPHGILVR